MQTTSIEWADKSAATRIGVSLEEYRRQVSVGCKWCRLCKQFHPAEVFNRDRTRRDGLSTSCAVSLSEFSRGRYIKRGRTRSGPPPSPPRNMDKKQARRRVNLHVRTGRWPHPNTIKCTDCGHLGGDRRHEFDHFLGYEAAHHEDVQVVCCKCHAKREKDRRLRNADH